MASASFPFRGIARDLAFDGGDVEATVLHQIDLHRPSCLCVRPLIVNHHPTSPSFPRTDGRRFVFNPVMCFRPRLRVIAGVSTQPRRTYPRNGSAKSSSTSSLMRVTRFDHGQDGKVPMARHYPIKKTTMPVVFWHQSKDMKTACRSIGAHRSEIGSHPHTSWTSGMT